MTTQAIALYQSPIWNWPFNLVTGARKMAFRAPSKEFTSVNSSNSLRDWLALSETTWICNYDIENSEDPTGEIRSTHTAYFKDLFVPTRIELRSEFQSEPTITTTEDQITLILSALSLRVTEFANLMDVQRPTVYAWLQGEFSPQTDKKVRLSNIFELAIKWRHLSPSPLGRAVRDTQIDDTNILELLKQKKIDQKRVLRCFESLINSSKQVPNKSKRKGLVAEALRRQGIDPSKAKIDNSELIVISGRRFEED